jgi:hypothetical protein
MLDGPLDILVKQLASLPGLGVAVGAADCASFAYP